jgi:hypothetical protein
MILVEVEKQRDCAPMAVEVNPKIARKIPYFFCRNPLSCAPE